MAIICDICLDIGKLCDDTCGCDCHNEEDIDIEDNLEDIEV